ncbi:MAG: hypothetical protein OXP28_09500, partial [Gammaproteobacteria bacterium]|nr:hypothetical protein [Gammaproteobacteria bacterium]MDE0225358.1 hypothetical protein [Gammaproteobacteria bacterium]
DVGAGHARDPAAPVRSVRGARFARLATISNGHVYNRATYCAKRTLWTKTRAATVDAGTAASCRGGNR